MCEWCGATSSCCKVRIPGEQWCCDECGHIQLSVTPGTDESSILAGHKAITAAAVVAHTKPKPVGSKEVGTSDAASRRKTRTPVRGLKGWVKCVGVLRDQAEVIADKAAFSSRLSELRVWSLLYRKLHGRRPRALDLFSGQGGAAHGLALAGFTVRSVDILVQPAHTQHPQVSWVLGDALEQDMGWADLVWASPPCQSYSTMPKLAAGRGESKELRLIEQVRQLCVEAGKPYVIENVMGARDELVEPVGLCGTMMGLDVIRHRLFECSFTVSHEVSCAHAGR
jgi:hypothetical protein